MSEDEDPFLFSEPAEIKEILKYNHTKY